MGSSGAHILITDSEKSSLSGPVRVQDGDGVFVGVAFFGGPDVVVVGQCLAEQVDRLPERLSGLAAVVAVVHDHAVFGPRQARARVSVRDVLEDVVDWGDMGRAVHVFASCSLFSISNSDSLRQTQQTGNAPMYWPGS